MHAKAYASISLYGDTPPSIWTEYFGVEPDTVVIRGQLFKTPSGRMSKNPGSIGLWGCGSKFTVTSNKLNPHVRYLITRLALPRADLPALLEQRKSSMRLFCYWLCEHEADAPSIDRDLQDIVTQSGGIVAIDQYRDYDDAS